MIESKNNIDKVSPEAEPKPAPSQLVDLIKKIKIVKSVRRISPRPGATQKDTKRGQSPFDTLSQITVQEVPINYVKPSHEYQDNKTEDHFEDLRQKVIDEELFNQKLKLNKALQQEKRLQAQADAKQRQIMPVSRDPTHLYEGSDYLVVNAVHVDRLPPSVIQQSLVKERVPSEIGIEKKSDYAQHLLHLKEEREARLAEFQRLENESAQKDKVKKDKWLKQHPEFQLPTNSTNHSPKADLGSTEEEEDTELFKPQMVDDMEILAEFDSRRDLITKVIV